MISKILHYKTYCFLSRNSFLALSLWFSRISSYCITLVAFKIHFTFFFKVFNFFFEHF